MDALNKEINGSPAVPTSEGNTDGSRDLGSAYLCLSFLSCKVRIMSVSVSNTERNNCIILRSLGVSVNIPSFCQRGD